MTIVIVREDLLGKARASTPTMLDYKIHADNDSLYNTPPCWSIYICGLVFERLLRIGGLEAVEANNKKKAALIYDVIEASNGFYRCPVDKSVRSLMNIPFTMETEALEKDFLKEADKRGLLQLKARARRTDPPSLPLSRCVCARRSAPGGLTPHAGRAGAPLRRGDPRVGLQRHAARGGAGAVRAHEGAPPVSFCPVCVRPRAGPQRALCISPPARCRAARPQEFMTKHAK